MMAFLRMSAPKDRKRFLTEFAVALDLLDESRRVVRFRPRSQDAETEIAFAEAQAYARQMLAVFTRL